MEIDNLISNSKCMKTMLVNKEAVRGGFFGGYPVIFNNLENIEKDSKYSKVIISI